MNGVLQLSLDFLAIRLNKDHNAVQGFTNVVGFTLRGLESSPIRTGKLQLQGRTDCLTIVTSERIELTYVDPRTSYIILKI